MDELQAASKSLPFYALGPAVLVATILLLLLLVRTSSAAGRFLIFAIWLRLILQALHEFSFESSPLGMSWNAVASVCIVALSGFVIRRRSLFDMVLLPIYVIMVIMVISGIANGQVGMMITSVTKYAYLAVLILAAQDAFEDLGPKKLLRLLILPFMIPVLLQLLSLALGVAAGEDDRSTSFIGGFNHESVFSVCLLGALLVVSLAPMTVRLRLVLIAYGLAAIFLANYRTAVLAAVPLVAITLLSDVARRFISTHRPVVTMLGVLVVGVAIFTGAMLGQERFAEFGMAAQQGTDLIRPANEYSAADQNFLSGRPYIWSLYLDAWWAGSPGQMLIGFGPDTWTFDFKTYAHNTLVSTIYEMGIAGLAAMIFLWVWMARIAYLARGEFRMRLLGAHLSFFILNMATMPMWQIEGMIFYGLLCGFGAYCFKHADQPSRVKGPRYTGPRRNRFPYTPEPV